MSLKDTIARFRANPVIKLALGRKEKPTAEDLYDALRRALADPELKKFMQTMCEWEYRVITERPFDGSERKLYLAKGVKLSNAYQEATEHLNLALSRAVRNKFNPWVRDELRKWCDSDYHRNALSDSVIKELSVMENVRPEGPVTLYRGIMFKKYHFKGDSRIQSPQVFLDALAHGHTEIVIEENMSSWTASPDIANRFATKNAAGSQHVAMLNWLHNAHRFIDGELGLVFEASFGPDDVICEVDKLDLGHLVHGSEAEFIIKPGHHKVKIIHIYTPTGEIDANQFSEWIANRDQPAAA